MTAEKQHEDSLPVGWVPLENRLYRQHQVYKSLQWSFSSKQLSSSIVAVAPFGGPIALIPDAGWGLSFALAIYNQAGALLAKFDRVRTKQVPPFRAVSLGWSSGDLLSIVYSDGVLVRLPVATRLDRVKNVSVFQGDSPDLVYDATIISSADVVIRTASGGLFHVDAANVVHTYPVVVAPPQSRSSEAPNCTTAAISPNQSTTDSLETILITENGKLTMISATSSFSPEHPTDVSHVTLSPSGQHLACLDTTNGRLFVMTSDLRGVIAHIDLTSDVGSKFTDSSSFDLVDPRAPDNVSWVGNDALALTYRENVVLVGPRGGVTLLHLSSPPLMQMLVLGSENDGLRVFTTEGAHFLQMVPEPLNSVLTHRSHSGNKLLWCTAFPVDASKGRGNSTPVDALRRYRLLRELKDTGAFLDAARSCVSAALQETDIKTQKHLLHAAANGIKYFSVYIENSLPTSNDQQRAGDLDTVDGGFKNTNEHSAVGHKFLATKESIDDVQRRAVSLRDSDLVPTAIAVLRVINAVANVNVGIPMTKAELDLMGIAALVARLSSYGHYTLAIRIATFGGISPYDILSEWATTTILENRNEADEALTLLISERFEAVHRSFSSVRIHSGNRSHALPYVKAAETAFAIGKSRCAELLLRREVRPAPKVAMYLRMSREASAIVAAVSSGDPELVLDVLGSVLEKKYVRETARMLRSLPPSVGHRATDLLATHLRQIGDLKALRLVYLETGRFREAALVDIQQLDSIDDSSGYIAAVEKAVVQVGRGHGRRVCQFEVQALQHAAVVGTWALEVEKKSKLEYGSLRHANDGDLLAQVVQAVPDKAQRNGLLARVRSELQIPDRRFLWVCLSAMAEVGEFDSIETLSRSYGNGRAPPIGLNAFVETCLKHNMEEEAVKYALRITDLRDRARALAKCGRGREAAEIAARLQNQQLLDDVQGISARHVPVMRIALPRHAVVRK